MDERKEYNRPQTRSLAVGAHGQGLCMTLPIGEGEVSEAWGKENRLEITLWEEEDGTENDLGGTEWDTELH